MARQPNRRPTPEPTLFSKLVAGAVPEGAAFYPFAKTHAGAPSPLSGLHPENFDEGSLRQALINDLAALLNAQNLQTLYDNWARYHSADGKFVAFADRWPDVATSVINYGVGDIAGRSALPKRIEDSRRQLLEAIRRFEPRLDPAALDVVSEDKDSTSAILSFLIEAQIDSSLADMSVAIKTTVDSDGGDILLGHVES